MAFRSSRLLLFFWAFMSVAVAACSLPQPGHGAFPFDVQKELELSTAWVGPGNPRSPVGAVAVAWSPDGSKIAATSDYGDTITVWDSAGKLLSQFQLRGNGPRLGPITFTPDSRDLLFPPNPDLDPKDAALIVWNALSGRQDAVFTGPDQADRFDPDIAYRFAASADGAFVAVASAAGLGAGHRNIDNIITYNPNSGAYVRRYRVEGAISSLNVRGPAILVGNMRGQVAVIDGNSSNPPRYLQPYAASPFGAVWVAGVAESPDGSLLLAGDGGGVIFGSVNPTKATDWLKSLDPVRLLRTRDGAVLATLKAPYSIIRDAKWDPKGRYVAVLDGKGGLFLWRPLSVDSDYRRIQVPGASLWLAISPDGDHIAVATDNGVNVYHVR